MQEKQGLSGWVNVALRNHCEGTIVREESKQKGLAALPRVWRGLSAGLWEMGSILWRWRVALSDFLGIAFLGIGLWAWNEKGVLSNISSITDLGGFDPVWLFLVVGGVMFILGFAGCIGALRENTFLLKFFSVFLGIIFFLELTAGVLAFVFKDWIKDQLYFFINNNIRAYRDDIDLQNLIDFTQEYIPMQVESDVACHSPAVLKILQKMSSTLSVAMMPGKNQKWTSRLSSTRKAVFPSLRSGCRTI
ncbi:tetraspanin-5 isoform X6 [Manis javanica]|uniref:tetraspanin-5 isoform X6 n=1 Tax=Manis javanica TaxID=9974 RepID=UPI003C6D8D53